MNKKMKLLKALTLVLVMLSVLAFSTIGLADAGDFSGDSDYGGSWDSGSDWDSSSDWSSSSSSSDWSSSDSSDDGFSFGGFIVVAIIVVGVIVFMSKRGGKGGGNGGNGGNGGTGATPAGGAPTNRSTVDPTELKKKDPNFSTQEFLEKVSNNYVQMQNCWQDKDWEPMRPLMADGIYNQFARQLDALKRNGWTNYVERIAVLGTRIVGYYQDNINDNLVVELRTRITDYTVEDSSGNVIKGSKTAEKFMTYEWTLIRSKDKTTQEKAQTTEVKCPNCGAPLSINHSGKCPYCDQVISLNEYDWVISAIRGISQVTK